MLVNIVNLYRQNIQVIGILVIFAHRINTPLLVSSNIVCAVLSLIINLTLSILLFYKSQKARDRIIYGSFTLYYALNNLYYLYRSDAIHTLNGNPFSFSVLSSGSFIIAVFLIFPLEVLLPPRLSKRWILPIFLIPWALFTTIWIVLTRSGMHSLHLSDMYSLVSNLNDASVVLRLFFFCCILFFFFAGITFMIWAHNRYMTDRILRTYAYATIPVMLIYICIICWGLSKELYMLHVYYMICFNVYISYLILTSKNVLEKGKKTIAVETEIEEDVTVGNEMKRYELQLLHQLDEIMETRKLYCSSELSLPELARMLGTNRTTLSKIIRCKGYSNFAAYLNAYRMEEFLRITSSNEANNLAEAALLAGFGSKASLYRCFIAAYGISPSEHLKARCVK